MSFRSYGQNDDQPAQLGDAQFTRFATRGEGVDLPDSVLRYAENIRLGRKTVRPRKGTKALATDIELVNLPVLLDFTLGIDRPVTSITRVDTTATVTTAGDHNYSTGDVVAIEGAGESAYNGDQTITVTGADTFTYAVAGSPATPATGTITANAGPRIFDDYTEQVRGSAVVTDDDASDAFIIALTTTAYRCQAGAASVPIAYPAGETCPGPVAFEQFEGKVYLVRGAPGEAIAVSALAQTAGTATLQTAAAHGLETGDRAYVEGGNQNDYRGTVQITKTAADTFTYAVASGAVSPATGSFTIRPCLPPLVWDRSPATDFTVAATGPHASAGTFVTLPPTDWLYEFNRRLWLPWRRDQVLGTDYSDALTIDTDAAQARIRPGGNDWLVGVLGFATTRLFVAYRKSLHLLGLTITDLTISSGSQVQAKFGCAARQTIVDCAGQILFLTDGGVARLRVTGELNLLADQVPLSDDIQDLFERVNWAYAGAAVAQYFDNRYYLALPLDDATANNALFVYSFLNGAGWESVDTYPGDFDIQALHLADYEGRIRLHVVTRLGALFLMEELEVDEFGNSGGITSNVIRGIARTRYLQGGSLDVKRWLRALIDLNLAAGDACRVDVALRNPDQTATLVSAAGSAADLDVTVRPRIGRRGIACSLELTTTAGRPELKGYTLEAAITDRGSQSR